MEPKSHLISLVENLSKAKILCAGDVMLDRFVYGSVSRISPESPVPVLKTNRTNTVIGGAGNVVRNLIALGVKVSFITVIGHDSDGQGEKIKSLLVEYGHVAPHIFAEKERKTTVKTRFVASRQQMLRVDDETLHPLEDASNQAVIEAVNHELATCDAIILSDYGKGFFGRSLLDTIIKLAQSKGKPILVDPKGTDFDKYRRATVITPNLKELHEATGLPVEDDCQVVSAAKHLIDNCGVNSVLATRSQDGATLVRSTGEVTHLNPDSTYS